MGTARVALQAVRSAPKSLQTGVAVRPPPPTGTSRTSSAESPSPRSLPTSPEASSTTTAEYSWATPAAAESCPDCTPARTTASGSGDGRADERTEGVSGGDVRRGISFARPERSGARHLWKEGKTDEHARRPRQRHGQDRRALSSHLPLPGQCRCPVAMPEDRPTTGSRNGEPTPRSAQPGRCSGRRSRQLPHRWA